VIVQPLATVPILIDQVYERLMHAIAECVLPPGRRIRQAELAAFLGVSRQPVSHALQLLKRQNLVQDAGRKGLQVAPIDPAGIRQLYQARTALDGLASLLAAQQVAAGTADPQAETDLRRALADGAALGAASPIAAWVAADVAFHRAIYRLSGNPAIAAMVGAQWPHLMRSMAEALEPAAYRARAWKEHRQIAHLILAGEAGKAETAAKEHTEAAGRETETRLLIQTARQNDEPWSPREERLNAARYTTDQQV
jgi:DNA-binding GntR family transcriptional regulator